MKQTKKTIDCIAILDKYYIFREGQAWSLLVRLTFEKKHLGSISFLPLHLTVVGLLYFHLIIHHICSYMRFYNISITNLYTLRFLTLTPIGEIKPLWREHFLHISCAWTSKSDECLRLLLISKAQASLLHIQVSLWMACRVHMRLTCFILDEYKKAKQMH